jgi:eukaryotic-like serine/threonine-protein kinase
MISKGAQLKDRYRLERLLGRGGMASVWLASDEVLERPVAVKILSDTIASDPEFLARFRREARVAAGLSHPNLIGVYDYAEGAERPYLVMEYVPGDNLAERMSRNAEIDSERLARELLGALAHIHAAGIVHRDIKPQNVLVAPDGRAKLIDFGIALPKDATSLTRTGHLLGTARYIAPEVMGGKPATERSDLYSCGVVLRDCTGDNPPGHLRTLVERLTAANPRGRPVSAEKAATQVNRRAFIQDQPTEPFRPTTRSRRPEPSLTRRPWGKAAAIVAVFAALAVAFAVVTDGTQDNRGGKSDSSVATNGRESVEATVGKGTEADAPVPMPAGNDLAMASTLNEEGFEMIQAGRYEEAIPVLEEAIRAFPPNTEDLSYAYALFNLGNALRLSGRPEEAIPILERRLEIPNQTGVVRRELTAAQREARS